MKPTVIAVALLWASSAQAHCFTIWHYKTPQHCGLLKNAQKNFRENRFSNPAIVRAVFHPPMDVVPAILLPDMTMTWEVPGISRELYDGIKRRRAILLMESK